MEELINKLNTIKNNLSEIDQIKDLDQLEVLENKYLSRKNGELGLILKGLATLSPEEKKQVGAMANNVKSELVAKIEEKKKQLKPKGAKIDIDVTLPTNKEKLGHLHPISQLYYELDDIFTSMGFLVVEGPELESEYYTFDSLNIPPTHPARDMQDTFFVEGGMDNNRSVMRTQVSAIQVRAMRKYGAPLRCIMPGRVFRCESIDACHEHTFDQMDGLMIGKDISVANMIAVMKELLKAVFGRDMEVRTRPGYFPFVEPGFELDMKCVICNGAGCPSCKNSGWLEILPGGLIHPTVLKAGGLDPKKYSGLAFDVGVTRLAMMKYGIDNIRLFQSGDLRFLRQF